jgi:bacillopeptidase F (M6 metalloprotease family)
MVQDYSNNDTWALTTATSPAIDLAGVPTPILTFRMWVDTEGGTFDGVNLQISSDGGAAFQVLDTVTPAYPLTIAGEPAWGGQQAALGWQLVQADLTAYSGQTILLRFAFQSDPSATYPGVYIDDFLVE